MASTQLKKARRLLTLSTSEKIRRSDGTEFTPPLYYRAYDLTTVPESNAEGSWMGWHIERGPSLPDLDNWKALLEEIKTCVEARSEIYASENEMAKAIILKALAALDKLEGETK